ncbi:MAG: DUF1993 domain-containing protein [Pseudomonadota bacterium]
MAITLDKVFVPASLQMLGSVSGVLEKARAHAEEHGISEAEMLGLQLADDMWPLPNQIQGMWAHSAYAINQVKSGEYRPNIQGRPTNWDEMQTLIAKTVSELEAMEDGELDSIANETVYFIIGEKPMFEFTAQNFLLSFSMPNVHFHATTAYDILRMKGVQIGKFDFLGNMRNEKK